MTNYPILDYYRTKDIEKWYTLVKYCIIYKHENIIIFDDMLYQYDKFHGYFYFNEFNPKHQETSPEDQWITGKSYKESIQISPEDILKRLETFMRGHKLNKIMYKI